MRSPSPEYRLLVDALVTGSSTLTDCTDWTAQHWQRLLAAADWHRASPLLFKHLARVEGAPTWVTTELEERYLANAARNLYIAAALREVLAELAGAGIPAMALKGAALIESVYPEPALRELLDLDILVPEERIADAEAALVAIGYGDDPKAYGLAPTERAERAHQHHVAGLVHPARLTAVELHRHICASGDGRPFDIGEMWARARRVEPAPAHWLPAPEDLLMHVAFHFTRNRLGGSDHRAGTGGALAQLADIGWLLRREAIDWASFNANVRAYGLELRVFLALFAAAEIGIEVPGEVLGELRPRELDIGLARRLVALRVLRTSEHLGLRSLRQVVVPTRELLLGGWQPEQPTWQTLARAYARRVRRGAPKLTYALRRPIAEVQDYRLNAQFRELELETPSSPPLAGAAPEIALLVEALRPGAGRSVDCTGWPASRWERLLAAAEWHGISPMLFTHLSGSRSAPPWVVATLEERYVANAARMLFVRAALERVLKSLADGGIAAMPLKGAALIEKVYGDIAEREMLDLDVLVAPERLVEAEAIVQVTPLLQQHGVTAVELHTHVAMGDERRAFDVADVWTRARAIDHHPPHRRLSAEDLLLHLALNFTRRRLARNRAAGTRRALAQVADIIRVVEAEPPDWDAFVDAVRSYRLGTHVFLALFSAAELGARVPPQVLRDLTPAGFDAALARRLLERRVLRVNGRSGVRTDAVRRPLAQIEDQRLNERIRTLVTTSLHGQRPVRVLYAQHTALMSGAERSLLEMLAGLPGYIEPLLACPPGALADEARRRGVRWRPLPATAGSLKLHPLHTPVAAAELGRIALRLRRLAKSEDVDLIHANTLQLAVAAGAAPLSRPLVVHVRDSLPDAGAARLVQRWVDTRSDAVIAISGFTARSWGRDVDAVIANAVDARRFDPAVVDGSGVRAELGMPAAAPVLSVVAQITPWKGQVDAIFALAGVLDEHPDARLVIAGEPKFVFASTRYDNVAYMRELEETVERLDLAGSVHFLGERSDVPELLAASDLLLVPSWEEPFGRTIIEAMAMRVPPLATVRGGPAEIIEDGVDGVLLEPRRPEAWASAASALLADRERLRAMGERGRAKAIARYGRDAQAARVVELYRRLA